MMAKYLSAIVFIVHYVSDDKYNYHVVLTVD